MAATLFLGHVPPAQKRAWRHVRDAYPHWHPVADIESVMSAYEALVRKGWVERRASSGHGWEYCLSACSLTACGLPSYHKGKGTIAKGLQLGAALLTEAVQAGTHVLEFWAAQRWTQIHLFGARKLILHRVWINEEWAPWKPCWDPFGNHFTRTVRTLSLEEADRSPHQALETPAGAVEAASHG